MGTVTTPDFTGSVQQKFFIESQGGSQHPTSYLDRFPDNVYTKAIDSVLVSFLYALLGPVGVGQLTQEYLQARLLFEDAGLQGPLLDACYTSPFAFARLAEETYTIDAQAALLPAADRAQILQQDAAFRNRAQAFLQGARAGGTLKGLRLVAKAGLGREVDVIENYTALFDQFSDYALGVAVQGHTLLTNEIVILPRQELATNDLQTISIDANTSSGWFSLIFPGPPYQVIPVTTTSGSAVITVPDSSRFPAGVYVSITPTAVGTAPGTATSFAMSGGPLTSTTVSLVYPMSAGGLANTAFLAGSSGTFMAYVGNAQTTLLPYYATAFDVQNAMNALPIIGGNNVNVTGGPLPGSAIAIELTGMLSNTKNPITMQLGVDPITGVVAIGGGAVAQLATTFGTLPNYTVEPGVIGASADGQVSVVTPQDEQGLGVALDQVRPVTSIVSMAPAAGTTIRQTPNAIFTEDSYTEVLRFVTGSPQVQWPGVDPLHWIEAGVEHEGLVRAGDAQQNYQGFHNIVNAYAYTEGALADPYYSDPTLDPAYGTTSFHPVWERYWDTMIGPFSASQVLLYPVLANYQNLTAQYPASGAAARMPEPLILTSTVDGIGIINRIYPADYLSAQGAPPLAQTTPFWSSSERNSGIDYLELDLGAPLAVNFIYFEATSKPYVIDVAYDTLDMSPHRRFAPVTIAHSAPSVLSLDYNAVSANPWMPVPIYCANSLGLPIYTRFIRIGLTRDPGNSPFAVPGQTVAPYSIEIRNLRIGRSAN